MTSKFYKQVNSLICRFGKNVKHIKKRAGHYNKETLRYEDDSHIVSNIKILLKKLDNRDTFLQEDGRYIDNAYECYFSKISQNDDVEYNEIGQNDLIEFGDNQYLVVWLDDTLGSECGDLVKFIIREFQGEEIENDHR